MKKFSLLLFLFILTACTTLYKDSMVSLEPGDMEQRGGTYEITPDGLLLTLHNDSYLEKVQTIRDIPGFTVHSEAVHLSFLKNALNPWYKGGANWYIRDSNSLFIRFSENPELDQPYLFPGMDHKELIRLTNEHGVIFWMTYPSLLWISARDEEVLRQGFERNETLQVLIKRLAYNKYEKGSWYNAAGYPLNLDFSEYDLIQKSFSKERSAEQGELHFKLVPSDLFNPSYYLKAGPRSNLKDSYASWIREELLSCPPTPEGLIQISHWVNQNFQSGVLGDHRITVNDFFKYRMIQGCRTQSLVLAVVLRTLGIPAVSISTVDLPTARLTDPGESISNGHDMVEAYIEGKWYLLDGAGRVSVSYDPINPYIIRVEADRGVERRTEGFVLARGLDNWDYGILNEEDYRAQCTLFLQSLREGEFSSYLSSPALVYMVSEPEI